ncbi:MAG TPA: hypothetical protein VLB73_03040 [Patescibacteria group bacterium]|nr:hypothetical protein [Patescibacteria group bacterium]
MRNLLANAKDFFCIFVVFFLLIFLFNHGLWNTFFQQDEWNGFGTVIALSHGNPLNWFSILGVYHFIPFSQFFIFLLYKLFGYQAQYFALVSLTLHSIATTFVYFVSRKLVKSSLIGLIIAIVFGFNANTSQAYLHLAIFPATITCFIAVMAFLLYVVNVSKKHIFSLKDALILLTLFYASISLREDGLVLILIFPLWLLLFQGIKHQIKNKKFLFVFSSGVFLFFLFRVVIQIFSTFAKEVATQNYVAIVAQNLLWFFPKITAQIFINGNSLLVFLLNNTQVFFGTPLSLDTVVQYLLPTTLLLIFLAVLVLIFLGLRLEKNATSKKVILFGIGWTIGYSILLSSVGRQMNLVESRYLYFPSFGILLATIISLGSIRKLVSLRYQHFDKAIKLFLLFALIVFLANSYKDIRTTVQNDIVIGNVRKTIINSLVRTYPTLPKKAIIFVRCKTVCHKNEQFGITSKAVLPFSSGAGYIFLLQYAQKNENGYADFFKKQKNDTEFLWDFESEGYKESNGFGYGYFIHENLLRKAIQDYKLSKEVIIGLEYNEDTFTLRDISSQVQQEIFAN